MTTSEKLEPDRDGDIANRLVARVVAAPVVDLAVWTLVDIHQRDEPTSCWYYTINDPRSVQRNARARPGRAELSFR